MDNYSVQEGEAMYDSHSCTPTTRTRVYDTYPHQTRIDNITREFIEKLFNFEPIYAAACSATLRVSTTLLKAKGSLAAISASILRFN